MCYPRESTYNVSNDFEADHNKRLHPNKLPATISRNYLQEYHKQKHYPTLLYAENHPTNDYTSINLTLYQSKYRLC